VQIVVWIKKFDKVRCNVGYWSDRAKIRSGCRLQFIRDAEKKVPYVVETCFNTSWLDATAENDATGRTNREVLAAVSVVISELDHANNNTLQVI
jgi:hypothetical protein